MAASPCCARAMRWAGRCCWWAAGAQGRRHALVRVPLAVGVRALGVRIQRQRGLPRGPLLRLLTQRAFKGGGALVCSVPLAIWLMASKQW